MERRNLIIYLAAYLSIAILVGAVLQLLNSPPSSDRLELAVDRWCSSQHMKNIGSSVVQSEALVLEVIDQRNNQVTCRSTDVDRLRRMILQGFISLPDCAIHIHSKLRLVDENQQNLLLYANQLKELVESPQDYSLGVVIDANRYAIDNDIDHCDAEMMPDQHFDLVRADYRR